MFEYLPFEYIKLNLIDSLIIKTVVIIYGPIIVFKIMNDKLRFFDNNLILNFFRSFVPGGDAPFN